MQALSAAQARRIALAAQGFAIPRTTAPHTQAHLARILSRIAPLQIDSVNVLTRAHYLPLFSRLGAYPRALLDAAAWSPKKRLFEYWAHEASLLPLALHPLLRWRMQDAANGTAGWGSLRAYGQEKRPAADAILARIAAEGPLCAADFEHGKSRSGWWEWGDTKRALEYLFWSGQLTTATRKPSFARVYDLPSRVLPAATLALPTPSPEDARRALLAHAATALGIATAADLRDYFRLTPAQANTQIQELVDAGSLIPTKVEGWTTPAFLHHAARLPRAIKARALLAPFDPLIWERPRTQRLFNTRYRIEIYTPAPKREHGYYVLPFLLHDRIVARVDLKSDRKTGTLIVQSTHYEPGAPAHTAEELAAELRLMADWLDLATVRHVARP